MKTKRFLSLLLAVMTILSTFCGLSFSATAASVEVAEVAANTELAENGANYGLMKNIQGSAILHCFDWKYNDIKAELKSIAEAGFTAVQTSPAQPANSGCWWWLYQPKGFYVGNNSLGSKNDLQTLCQEAEKYGIKVVVDVVANHLAGDHSDIQNELKDGQYWHSHGGSIDYSNRWQIHQGEIGMPDINSEHPFVQQKVSDYVKELSSIGVDGIRWDAAKHIAVPSEQNCQFWPKVTSAVSGMWHYGEILDDPVANNGSLSESLMKEYSNYISVTDSGYSGDVRMSFRNGQVSNSVGNYASRGVAKNKIVYWAESHDTYSNNNPDGRHDSSQHIDQNKIDRAYAVVASQNGASALYFSRPNQKDKDSIMAGQKGSVNFKKPEVAAVNQLKNACDGEKEYMTTADNVAVVCRESGATIVLGSGSDRNVTVPNAGGTTKPGTYKDLVSGGTFTVTNSQISGQVGQSGIAVLLNAAPRVEGPSAYAEPGSTNYTTDTFKVTLKYENATSGQYSVNGGAFQSFTNGQTITIGKGTAAGTKTTITVKASNGKETSDPQTYEYKLSVPADPGIYYDNSQTKWGSVNCYIYKDGQGATQWPGVQMTKVQGDIWVVQPPSGFENCQVIFSDNGNNQYPAEEGLKYTGNAMICNGSEWKEHTKEYDGEDVVPTQPKPTSAPTKPTEIVATTVVQPTEAPKPTEAPTTLPEPTVVIPTEVPTTQAPVKTDPTEDDDIIIIPPTPTKPVKPTQPKPVDPDLNAGEKHLYGDVDKNGKVSIKDATLMQKALAKMTTLSTIQIIVSDVNADTKVNVKDVTAIQKLCANILKVFTAGLHYIVPGTATKPVATEAPKPVVTQAPATQAPVTPDPTEAPVPTQPKPTQPQPTQPQPVVTQAPTTQEPVIEPTEAPTTQAPVTEPPVTEAPTQPQPDNYIYLKSTWSSVNCHSWASAGGSETTWPGTAMESLGNGIFRIELPQGHDSVVFNGDGQQTDDIRIQGTGMIWDGSWQPYSNNNNNNNNNSNVEVSADCVYFKDAAGWNTVNCHSWTEGGEGTTWPGTPMESLGNGLYKIKLPEGHTHVVFNAGGDHCQTDDMAAQAGKAYNNSTGQWETI